MKTIFLKTLFLILFTLLASNMFAVELTMQEKEALQLRVKSKIDEYQFYLGQLADKLSTSTTVKDNAFRLATKLFIGECEKYTIKEPKMENGVERFQEVIKPAVRMETSSKYRSTKSRTEMKRYLNNLRNDKTSSQIEITDADVVRVDNIYKVGDHYECMAYFCQKYVKYRDNRVSYSDITTKKVRVYIQAIQIPKSDGRTEIIWNALLGDIYVIDTRPAE